MIPHKKYLPNVLILTDKRLNDYRTILAKMTDILPSENVYFTDRANDYQLAKRCSDCVVLPLTPTISLLFYATINQIRVKEV
jgi:hypothetical protein